MTCKGNKSLLILLMVLVLSGCSTLGNKTVVYTKYGPGPMAETNILNTWKLSVPGKSDVDFDPATGKIIYKGKTASTFDNIKTLLMLKAVQTDVSVSNKEGK